ncbi:cysteine desulfurase family protein [Brumimicrobium oceani]|uniref:cysteine desulfurase n=1 Tax=Brumimicrobium oceani TaxID=2100725 RepID=A0A2U2XGV6_9FLAO|nr:cysteine desulfurase family protein [Brumimicrobium oceani]PWH87032.1 cysteine desulfurase [Brumimicrobium oceani]
MKVYLDNAATTPVAPEVFEAMVPYLKNEFGNPSSTHSFGRQAKGTIETSRRKVAGLIKAKPSEIIFTSGGTEADNMAFSVAINELGVKRIITSEIEHHAVIHTAEDVCKKNDLEFALVKLLPNGHVDLEDLEELLAKSDKKTLVSLMHGNNEIGNLLPLQKVSEMCRKHKAYFHSDTVQTMAHYSFDLSALDIDFITGAAHKFHGPKGVGFLYINNNIKGLPFIHGGSQERGLRGGTENLYGIVGLAKAMEIAYEDLEAHQNHVQGLKSHMIEELRKNIEDVSFHGDITPENSLYTVVNVCLPKTSKSAMLLFTLDLKGVACSGGSACTSGSAKGSHVLEGIQADTTRPNVRFSFSRYTTKEEVDYAVGVLKEAFEKELVD